MWVDLVWKVGGRVISRLSRGLHVVGWPSMGDGGEPRGKGPCCRLAAVVDLFTETGSALDCEVRGILGGITYPRSRERDYTAELVAVTNSNTL